MRSTTLLGTAALFISAAQAENATTVSATGCVDGSAMQSCLDSANTSWEECTSSAGSNAEVIACSWTQSVDQIGCYLKSCWNKVYSCEYQVLVGGLLEQQLTPPKDPIPFWPAPENAPGGCSCNLGQIYTNATASVALIQSTCNNYVTTGFGDLEDCQCCAWSAAVSSFYGICPGYDLSNFGLSSLAKQAAQAEAIGGSCAGLTSSTCLGKFGIGSADDGKYLDPANLPAGGDKVLSTTGAALTSPPGGATMTVTFASSTYTITAAEYTGVSDSGSSGSDSGSDSGSSGADTTGSGSGSGGTTTSTGAGATDTGTGAAGSLKAYGMLSVLGVVGAIIVAL